jgi:CubicO group peptidase (beta-lactamase class C family)
MALTIGVVGAVTIALVGCTSPKQSSVKLTDLKNPNTAAVALPPGSIDKAVDKLPGLIAKVMKKTHVPGLSVAVVHGDKTVFAEGYGVREVGKPGKVDAKTVFRLASVSKPIGASVVASEVSKGAVKWDTPAAQYLPGFALADPWVTENATIGDFYAMRTGLPHAAGDLIEDIGYDRTYVLDHLAKQPLAPFRDNYDYANFSITAGAEATANAAGTDWATMSENDIYKPLGMTSTSSRNSDFLAQTDRATMHAYENGKFQALYQRNPDPESPAGGVSSNAVDMAKWMSMIIGNGTYKGTEVISPEALTPMITPEQLRGTPASSSARAGFYGYGIEVGVQPGGRTILSHSGGFSQGAATNMRILPSAGVGIIVLTNGPPQGIPEALTQQFMDLVQFGHITQDWLPGYYKISNPTNDPEGDLVGKKPPTSATPAAAPAAYTGTYHNDTYGTLTVSESGGKLMGALGPDGKYTFALDHWDGNDFSFVPTGENAPLGSLSSANFAMTGATASAVTLGFFNTTKLGTWTR